MKSTAKNLTSKKAKPQAVSQAARRTKPAPKASSAVSPPRKPLVYITGDQPLVEEFAALCAAHQYDVAVDQAVALSPEFAAGHTEIRPVARIPEQSSVALELTNIDPQAKRIRLEQIDSILPPTAPVISSSVTVTATEQATWLVHRHRLVGIGALPTLSDRPAIEAAGTIYSPRESFGAVATFFASLGKELELVQDRIGMVLPRMLCQMINEAAFAVQEEIAAPRDIDTALKLGAGLPFGPIEWGERIGMRQVAAVILALHRDLGEERYRPAPLLRQFAATGHWWKL